MTKPKPNERPIVQLSTQLANQIAAGEVVERPASVVKELVENSLDANASQIDIEIINGGKQLIRVRDNGHGIAKEQLALALAPHATSKIESIDDLLKLYSFGFRGEALASISSVAKFRLTSKTAKQQQGWCATTTGEHMEVSYSPAPAVIGTMIDVEELFHNTPARRRFLRTDKTEFAQIDLVVKQIALANPEVTIVLKHNQRVVKRYKAAHTLPQREQRLATVCGKEFVDNCVRITVEHEQLSLNGWISLAGYHRSQTDGQYVFVNQRPVKDKVLSHALREAYLPHLPEGRHSAYVLFLEIPPDQVDVNVHPTKHEVRFHRVREVHDFIVQALEQSLHQGIALSQEATDQSSDTATANIISEPYRNEITQSDDRSFKSYAQFIDSAYRTQLEPKQVRYSLSDTPNQSRMALNSNHWLIKEENQIGLLSLTVVFDYWLDLIGPEPELVPLLFPQMLDSQLAEQIIQIMSDYPVEIQEIEGQWKIVAAVKSWHSDDLARILSDYICYKSTDNQVPQLDWVGRFVLKHNNANLIHFHEIAEVQEFFSGKT